MGSRAARRRGEGGELEGLREYRVGEDARRIDWKASLRLGRPIAREYREDAGSHVAVAIDCGRLMAAEAGGQSILDRALAALVVLASTVLSSGDSLSCLAFADTVKGELPELRKGASLASLSAFAGGLEPAPVEADYRLAAFRLLSSLTKRSLVVILTDAAETMRLDSLEAAVTSLSRRHAVVVALLRDERAEAASAEAATDAPSAFRKAAASELVLARDLLAARLRRRAAVLFVRPHELTSTLLDAYAEAKERRRF